MKSTVTAGGCTVSLFPYIGLERDASKPTKLALSCNLFTLFILCCSKNAPWNQFSDAIVPNVPFIFGNPGSLIIPGVPSPCKNL